MADLLKTGAISAAAGVAIPVGGLSGLLTAGFGLTLILAFCGIGSAGMTRLSVWGLLTSEVMGYFIVSLAVFVPTLLFLRALQRKAKILVDHINIERQLCLDSSNLLGYPSPAFLVFDRQNHTLASCNSLTGEYQIYDFSWVLAWQITWREVEQMEMNGGSRVVNATGMSVPTFERTVRAKDFALELNVANPQQPVLSFPMTRRGAERWCAILNALFYG